MTSPITTFGRACALTALLPLLAACGPDRPSTPGAEEIIRHPAYQWDLNNNGAVTRNEYLSFRDRIFLTADKDSNGVLDEDEWEDAQDDDTTGIRRASFEALDFNRDGNLSYGEVTSLPQTDFDAIDANSDGIISSAELNNASRTRVRGGLRRRDADEGFRRDPNSGL